MGIRKGDVKGVGAKDDVAELDAMRWDGVTEREIILAEEVREVMKQNKENVESSSIQVAGYGLEIGGPQEQCNNAQQGKEGFIEGGPALSILRRAKLWHEQSTRDEAHP